MGLLAVDLLKTFEELEPPYSFCQACGFEDGRGCRLITLGHSSIVFEILRSLVLVLCYFIQEAGKIKNLDEDGF